MAHPTRRIFLWASTSPTLRERLPRTRFMQRAVRRFMPGETMDDALAAAAEYEERGIGTLYTRLGENIVSLDEAQGVADHYIELLDEIRARGIIGEPSVKPTQLGLDLDAEATFQHLSRLASHAEGTGSYLWIDMESSAYVDATLELYRRLKQTHDRVGICLQAYLRRTARDVEALLPLNPAVRLVKGAYDEPRRIAYTDTREVDANFLALSVTMLRERNVRLGLGTHDVRLIEQLATHAAALGLERDAFEIQMLYGIRTNELLRLRREGFRCQVLIAYGASWYPWYLRRLAERPANVGFVARQMLPW